ncbi:MAG: xanthine dehydrogenase family protein molybdopterin-binding subunit [Defluviicoccus sp.]|nr:xanthine dehydrogenase family protein molybdopterin-binding subunit [Defluviicoccus sp.]
MKFGVGQPVARTEDPRFLKGEGRYVDDIVLPGEVHGYVLRSPHAAARIRSVDVEAARRAPGVVLVLTREDVEADGVDGIPHFIPPMAFGAPPPKFSPLHPVLAGDRVRHVGTPVAFVVAETLDRAMDAAETVAVDYEVLPSVTAPGRATAEGAPAVWDEAPDNIWFTVERGDRAATDAAFARAAHVTRLSLSNNRLSCNAMEPRATIVEYRSATDHVTMYTENQSPHAQRSHLSYVFHKPEGNFRVISPDVGGGFGMKNAVYPEDALCVIAARRLGRPVRWTADRTESLQSDAHARDAVTEAALALDAEGNFLALRAETDHAVGAYLGEAGCVPVGLGSTMYAGNYDLPAAWLSINAVFTNTNTVAPYRGAGRPEACYIVERLVDQAAVELGIDPVELRRRNYIKPADMPYQNAIMTVYDTGEFEKIADSAVALADRDGFAGRKAASEAAGRLRGLGVTYFIEIGAPFNDRMQLYFDPAGGVTIAAGTHSHGQGHQTVYAQMVSDWLGVEFESIRLVQGDTDQVAYGRGTYGSRSVTVGGAALKDAADQVIAKAKRMAAHLMEAAEADIEFADGSFTVAGTDKSIGIVDVARASFMPVGWPEAFGIGLEATGSFTPTNGNFPNGCHICEVEVDPETGRVELLRYSAVNDSGLIVNPLLFEGQVHGGLAQGIGQVLLEHVVYDEESGQLQSGSFMDYCMPRADDLPSFLLDDVEVHCATNPLGVKGAGETGTVAALPAVMHAILDALRPLGVSDLQMPATPLAVWQAIREAKAA